MRSTARFLPTACALALLSATPAQAERLSDRVQLSGFGTLGWAMTDRDDATYRTGSGQQGAGSRGSFALDTRIGVQLDARLHRAVTATVQALAKERPDGARPEPEWAFVRWQPRPDVSVRVGRMSLPVYRVSDFRAVGYANTPVRPPEDVYAQIPLQRLDGADIAWRFGVGDTDARLQLLSGRADEPTFDDASVKADRLVGATLELERADWTLRLAHVRADIDVDFPGEQQLIAGLGAAAAAAPSLIDPFLQAFPDGTVSARFDALSIGYDPGGWFVDLELARRRIDSWIADANGAALSAGWRVSSLTPYLVASVYREIDDDPTEALPDAFGALRAGLSRFYIPRDQRSLAAGLRWDLAPRMALTAQLERIDAPEVGVSFYREQDEVQPRPDRPTHLLAIALDVLF